MKRLKSLLVSLILGLPMTGGIDAKADSGALRRPGSGRGHVSRIDARSTGAAATAGRRGHILGSPRAQARPGAFTELVVQLELLGVPQEAPFELELIYRDTLLEAPRIVPPARPSASVDLASPGHLLLTREGLSEEDQPDALELASSAGQAPLFCEESDAGEWIVRLGFPIPEPEGFPEEEIPLELRLSVPRHLVKDAKACIATAVFETRGFVLQRGKDR